MSRNGFSFHRTELLAIGFFLLATAPAVLAQETSHLCCQPQSESMLPENDQQVEIGQQDIPINLRRNINVETQLSQLALKHSSNENIKKFSQQVLSENRTLASTLPLSEYDGFTVPARGARVIDLPSPNDDLSLSLQVPIQTQQAEKEMKKLDGPQFDQMYLVQMDAYIRNDLQAASNAAAMTNLPRMLEMGKREQVLATEREVQISLLTAEEHFKIE